MTVGGLRCIYDELYEVYLFIYFFGELAGMLCSDLADMHCVMKF